MENRIVLFISFLSTVISQDSPFKVTSINGRPIGVGGSAFSGSAGAFGASSSSSLGQAPASEFSITNVNGRPVTNNQGAMLNTNRIRVEVELIRFENPKSLMFDGRFCDVASKCDPQFKADLDLVKPLARWPGIKPLSTFQNILELTNQDVFDIRRIIAKDGCADVTTGNLRVQINDVDDVTQPDLIDEYECIFNIGRVSGSASDSTWSSVLDCTSLHHRNPPQTRLTFRHREYAVQPSNQFSPNC